MINLGAPKDALSDFQGSEAGLAKVKREPSADLLAGLVAAHWLAGNKEEAASYHRRLVAVQPRYGEISWVESLTSWTDAEKAPLLAFLAESQRPQPTPAPKNVSIRSPRRR